MSPGWRDSTVLVVVRTKDPWGLICCTRVRKAAMMSVKVTDLELRESPGQSGSIGKGQDLGLDVHLVQGRSQHELHTVIRGRIAGRDRLC